MNQNQPIMAGDGHFLKKMPYAPPRNGQPRCISAMAGLTNNTDADATGTRPTGCRVGQS